MKTIRFSLFTLAVLLGLSSFAQDDITQDVIYVHDGSIYRGRIKSAPGESVYKIEIYGRNTISIPTAQVDSVRHDPRIVVADRHTERRLNISSSSYARIEACGSLIMYTQEPVYPGTRGQYVFGGGLSFLAELCRPHRNFSFLAGLTSQVMNASNYSYQQISTSANGSVDRGVQVRFEVPIWFRWSWGHRVGMFFQFGVSTGFNCYQGRGYEQTSYYPPFSPVYGYVQAISPFINISPLAFGIRKELPSHLSFITYLEGAPINFEFIDQSNPWKPYLQLHMGINFDPKYFIKKSKEQRSSKLLQKNVL